ncbi:IS1634 family transposase [Alkalilimnicola ehrlichii]|uniref:IS1634 family transposase n=1 Tax=Alkalilimnicola ehrlichii TaxID=351052 RepID=UPI003BA14B4B
MYIRASRSGGHTYLRLVESYRDENGRVRQRQIAQLGRADQLEEDQVEGLIRSLRRLTGREMPEPGTPEFEAAQEVGGPWVLTELWRSLGLEEGLKRALRSSRRGFDAEALLRVMIFNRLCDPDSKLGVLRWLETVVMPGMDTKGITHQQLLRAMDALESRLDRFRCAMGRLLRPLIDQELSVCFYDLTTIRVHGEAELDEDIRRYGRSKDVHGPARQCLLGVVQTADGLPLDFEVFEGNTAEVRTLLPMLRRTLGNYPIRRVVLVADRGLLSLDNVAELEALELESGQSPEFILAVPAGRYNDFQEAVGTLSFETDRPSVRETRLDGRRVVVAHDPDAASARAERRRRKLDELVAYGERLAEKLNRQDEGLTERGRRASDRGAYTRFSKAVLEAEFSRFIQAELHAERFSFTVKEEALARAERLDGKLILLTNVEDLDAETVVARYKALADIERGFRVLKRDIEIAPVYHRLPKRIRAHAAICFLALLLHRVMRMRLKANDSPLSVERAMEQLRRIQRHRVSVDEKRLSGLTTFTTEQLQLFEHLGVEKPTEAAL